MASNQNDSVKCQRCSYKGPQSSFPRKANLQYAKTCQQCTEKRHKKDAEKHRKPDDDGENKHTLLQGLSTLSTDTLTSLLSENKRMAFELHAYVLVAPDTCSLVKSGHELAVFVSNEVRRVTGYRFNYKKKETSRTTHRVMTFTFYCAQLDGEQSKNTLVEDKKKRRARMTMDRYKCNGWLHVTVDEDNLSIFGIRITHHLPHHPYTDISIPESVAKLVEDMKNLPAAKIWEAVLHANPNTELTEKQIYRLWIRINEGAWRLSDDQLESAKQVLDNVEGLAVERIPIHSEKGMVVLAFSLRDILVDYGNEINEIAMDSTWRTNALGYELYAIVGEANGQALPLAFAFTASTDTGSEHGGKARMLQDVLQYVSQYCPNITYALSDKDQSEINAIHAALPHVKHQLCYWHAIRYIEERLAEDKPPAKYDPRMAHRTFSFIDPTWAPGVITDSQGPFLQNQSTCLPPVFILTNGNQRVPVWPNPPKVTEAERPIFCPKEHRAIVVEKFRIHMHQHPEIPFNDEKKTYLTASEIHLGAAKDMYDYCFTNELSQLWAYLWNRWYTPGQWESWARSADEAIPHLKTTMVVESLWRNIKHRDLAEYNRPRLDLVTHIVITTVLPRVKQRLAYICGLRRVGRAKALAGWQTDFRADWLDMSHSDEYRLVEKELRWLKAPAKTKGRTERLAEISEEANRPHGTYSTDLQRWTCSCPAYLISRFLLCKHLVRQANEVLNDTPLTSLDFFADLRRQYYPPYYNIAGIHYKHTKDSVSNDVNITILGQDGSAPHRTGEITLQAKTSPLPKSGVANLPKDPHDPQHQDTDERQGAGDNRGAGERQDADEDPTLQRVFYSEARRMNLKRCFDELLSLTDTAYGVHPKMSDVLEAVFTKVEKVGNDISEHKRKRKSLRTWKDSNSTTMYLD